MLDMVTVLTFITWIRGAYLESFIDGEGELFSISATSDKQSKGKISTTHQLQQTKAMKFYKHISIKCNMIGG